MKFMAVWKTVPGKYKTALDQFLRTDPHSGSAGTGFAMCHLGAKNQLKSACSVQSLTFLGYTHPQFLTFLG